MNERIKQLAAQAKKYVDDKWAKEGSPKYPEAHYLFIQQRDEKFAELIVRECYDTIKKDMELAHIQLIPIDFGIYANGRLRRIIKQHFGVEE